MISALCARLRRQLVPLELAAWIAIMVEDRRRDGQSIAVRVSDNGQTITFRLKTDPSPLAEPPHVEALQEAVA